jgi:hypothetical protein
MCYMNAQKKEEVIPSILAKESQNLELQLRRYGEKNFRDLFVIFEKWLGLIWNFFSKSRAFMKIGGVRVDTHEVQGPFCKVAGIKAFPDLIYNVKFYGPSPRCGGPRAAPVHGGPRTWPRRRLIGGRPERRPHAWNLAVVEEEGGGNNGEPHRLQEGVAEGWKWPGVGGE